MNLSNDYEFNQNLVKIAKELHQNEKFSVAVLAHKVTKAAEQSPNDSAIVMAANVFTKMASKQTFITRKELNKIYDSLYTTDTGLAAVFAEELARPDLAKPRTFVRSDYESTAMSVDGSKFADPLLLNALESAFDGSKEAKLYSKEDAVKAEKVCMSELITHDISPKSVSVFAGRGDVIICQATYETPKGNSYVLIPVEMHDGKALFPNMFLTQGGFSVIGKNNIERHVKENGGKSFRVDGQKLLDVLTISKHGVKTIDDIELAAIKVRAKSETPATYDPYGIVYKEVDSPTMVEDLEMPKTAEHEAFAKRMTSSKGVADHIFGEKVVRSGRDMLLRKLANFGYKNSQIAVHDIKNNGIVYAVSVDKSTTFKVPVKVDNGYVLQPDMVISANGPEEFSAEGIASVVREGSFEGNIAAEVSPVYGTKPSELLDIIRQAASEGNITKAEDALDVLAATDKVAYKTGVHLLMNSFGQETEITKTASTEHKCSMIVKNAGSKHDICGHLNLPLHKVYQDSSGYCRPLYRKGMSETTEGVVGEPITNKIILW